MADPTDFVTAAQEQFLEGLRQSQEATASAVRLWAESVQRFTEQPPTPTAPVRAPSAMIDDALVFAEQLLAAQQGFLKSLREAVAPAVEAIKPSAEESREPEQPSEVSQGG
jgi:hypothetical protein